MSKHNVELTVISRTSVTTKLEKVQYHELTSIRGPTSWRYFLSALELRRILRQEEPDILHAHYVSNHGWLGFASGYRPFVISAWGSDLLLLDNKSTFHRMISSMALRYCDALTVPSELLRSKAKALGVPNDRLKLIHWGIETGIFRPDSDDRDTIRYYYGISGKSTVILCPRAIGPLYNIDVVLRAFLGLVKDVPDLHLILIQFNVNHAYYKKLQNLIVLHDLDDNVHWLSQITSQEEMARLYNMSDIMVSVPSSESYGHSVFEALATGCATVISDLPVFEDVLIDGTHTLKVPACDVDALIAALRKLIVDRDLRENLHASARAYVLPHSVDDRVSEVMDLYESLAVHRA